MRVIQIVHGRAVVNIGGRFFALVKDTSLTDRIAHTTTQGMRGSAWENVMRNPLGSQVICNQKRSDGRRDARWARMTKGSKARFAKR